mgnify:CR=1 FL=1
MENILNLTIFKKKIYYLNYHKQMPETNIPPKNNIKVAFKICTSLNNLTINHSNNCTVNNNHHKKNCY